MLLVVVILAALVVTILPEQAISHTDCDINASVGKRNGRIVSGGYFLCDGSHDHARYTLELYKVIPGSGGANDQLDSHVNTCDNCRGWFSVGGASAPCNDDASYRTIITGRAGKRDVAGGWWHGEQDSATKQINC